jgi:single-stranded DNA-binding protein
MNGFYLVGKIISEPEKGETINGTKLCRLKISVDKAAKEQEENYETFEITVFRTLAEADYEIGQSVGINGKLMANNYEKDGTQYYNVRLVGNSISIIA